MRRARTQFLDHADDFVAEDRWRAFEALADEGGQVAAAEGSVFIANENLALAQCRHRDRLIGEGPAGGMKDRHFAGLHGFCGIGIRLAMTQRRRASPGGAASYSGFEIRHDRHHQSWAFAADDPRRDFIHNWYQIRRRVYQIVRSAHRKPGPRSGDSRFALLRGEGGQFGFG